ncbi:hypothetical protein PVAP13_5KG419614 [Panicum virgatum]|uniref:Uncharacterized protein n=1 Tax=Panicum virgatum TaxID=38727 RepID=A0A8T0SMH4_PANVG|nr:hypothetical protein PVAP13_5KG419614 [Panicum virgatum]
MAVEAVEMKLDAVMMTAPGSGWLFPGRSTKPAEDSAAFASGFGEFGGTKRPEASRKMAVTLERLHNEHDARSGEQGGGGQGQAGGNQEDEDDQGRAELHRLAPGVPLGVPPSALVHGLHRQGAAPQL